MACHALPILPLAAGVGILFPPQGKEDMSALINSHSGDMGEFYHGPAGSTVSTALQAINLHQKQELVSVLPRNQVPTTLLQSGVFDVEFNIPTTGPDYLSSAFLGFTLSNSSATGTTGVDGFSLIDFVEVRANGQVVQTLYGVAMRNTFILSHSNEKMASIASSVGISTTDYSAALNVAGSGTKDVYIPLFTILDSAEIPLWRQDVQWSINIRFKTGSQLITSGNGVITTITVSSGSMKLYLVGQVLTPEVKAEHDARLNSSGYKTFRYMDVIENKLALGSTTSGTVQSVNYAAQGPMALLYFHLGAAGDTGTAMYDSQTITTLDVLSNNQVISSSLGDNQTSMAFKRLALGPHFFVNTEALADRSINFVSFSEKPLADIAHGSNHGFYKFRGDIETIRLTPGATIASSAVLSVWAYAHSHVDIDYSRGMFVIRRRVL